MRKQFSKTIENLMEKDNEIVVLLGDIGIFNFKNCFQNYPERTYNIGILEQSMIGLASGMSLSGLNPIIHTIAPFLTERVYEQLKLNFGYQNTGGNFISVGGSYDYAGLGCTHQCPADIQILKMIENFNIIVPGNPKEFDTLFNEIYNNNKPNYFRLSEYSNKNNINVKFGKASIIKKGHYATVIAIGNMLDLVVEACKDLDVTILYYTTIKPFDYETLDQNLHNGKILLCEPYYNGASTYDITKNLFPQRLLIDYIGIEHKFLNKYGKKDEHDESLGITIKNIREKVLRLIDA